MMINKDEFENLTYQDFYEDKILLMEYDLTPDEMLMKDNTVFMKEIIINNQRYNFYSQFNQHYKNYHHTYNMNIVFSLKPLNESIHTTDFFTNLPKSWYHNGFNQSYLVYKHSILLNWEEITDMSYVNFLLNSTFEYLKEQLREYIMKYLQSNAIKTIIEFQKDGYYYKKLLKYMDAFDKTSIRNIDIIVLGKSYQLQSLTIWDN